jgi:hypothetical protein
MSRSETHSTPLFRLSGLKLVPHRPRLRVAGKRSNPDEKHLDIERRPLRRDRVIRGATGRPEEAGRR